MKLVIEINENEYIGIKSFPNGNTSYPWTLHLYDAVRNGTPLPKGHWEVLANELYVCSKCHSGKWTMKLNYCPNCGANMTDKEREE